MFIEVAVEEWGERVAYGIDSIPTGLVLWNGVLTKCMTRGMLRIRKSIYIRKWGEIHAWIRYTRIRS